MTSDARKFGGFAKMDPARLKEVSRMGGKAAQAQGRGHKFNSKEAKAASKKSHEKRAQKLLAATEDASWPS